MDMKAADAITAIVEFALPRFSSEDKLLHIGVDARASIYFEDGEERQSSRDIHFLFHRPSNYTKVFVGVEGYEYQRVKVDKHRRSWISVDNKRCLGADALNDLKWYMTCDHDSGWRSDGVNRVLHDIHLDMLDEVTYGDRMIYKKVHWYVRLGGLSNNVQFVSADVEVDKKADKENSHRDGYMKMPVNIRKYSDD